jgi:hypothetical protein
MVTLTLADELSGELAQMLAGEVTTGWEKWLTSLVDPFYAKDAKLFQSDEIDKAWAWLRADAV